jgi:transposase
MMSKVSKASLHLSNDELSIKIKTTVGFWRVQKWLIIYNAVNYPRKAIETANHLAVSESLVHKTISEYNKIGAKAIDTIGKGERRNGYLTIDQEKTFIESYIQKAQNGQIATAVEIKIDFKKLIGAIVPKSTIYRLLKRHNWRKIVPLPFHPKQKKEEQESFKKTSPIK